jgi:16S rRNA (adenine1518-N6/adenine1519-N6)-dimethyltransferase
MTKALVMVQAEVADRIVAGPGTKVYGVPSVKVAWYAEARRVATVPRTVFWPVPNVDSALVLLTRRPMPDADRKAVFDLVDAAFAQRRKTLRAALSTWAGSADRAAEILTRAGVDPTSRGETLTISDYVAVTRMAGKATS